jgi:hypothetical protein
MVVFNISEKWSNGIERTLTGHHEFDPQDDKVESAAGSNRRVFIDGNGNSTISGDKARIYCHYTNYNSILTVTLIPNFKDAKKDECSLKLRSRHEERPDSRPDAKQMSDCVGDAFGGYMFNVSKGKWKSQREPEHNFNHMTKHGSLTKKLQNGREYKLRFTVKDEGGKVRQIGEVDYNDGDGFVKVFDRFDNSPKSWMIDRSLYVDGSDSKSYFWIRNNGSDDSITVKDVSLEVLS